MPAAFTSNRAAKLCRVFLPSAVANDMLLLLLLVRSPCTTLGRSFLMFAMRAQRLSQSYKSPPSLTMQDPHSYCFLVATSNVDTYLRCYATRGGGRV